MLIKYLGTMAQPHWHIKLTIGIPKSPSTRTLVLWLKPWVKLHLGCFLLLSLIERKKSSIAMYWTPLNVKCSIFTILFNSYLIMTLWNRYHYQNSWCDSHLIENRILIKKYYGFQTHTLWKKRFKLSLPSPSLDWPLKNHLIILLSHHLYLHLICWAKAFLTLHPKPQTIKTGYLFHLCRSTLIVDFLLKTFEIS